MEKKWNFLSDELSRERVSALARKEKISPVCAALLLNRGVDEENIKSFFEADRKTLFDPFCMKDMEKAVKRIEKAICEKEKITVYGDYDVDGITSVAMLTKYLKKRGAVCTYYIPERESEGYGLNCDAIQKIKNGGTSLIVTVDNGIAAIKEAEFAKSLGIELVICDHHACPDILPDAAVVNPKRRDCPYPFKELAGAGVCFKLVCALEGDSDKIIDEYAEFVALATVADVVSLKGENRTLVLLGMEKMKKENIPWLDALCTVSGIEKGNINSYHIGFMLSPRLNAAGRMGTAYEALRLLLTNNMESAMEIAESLNVNNNLRKDIGNAIYDDAVEMIENGNFENKKVIVLAKEGWHGGIIGIIASKIADAYGKNVFLFTKNGEDAKGSGRGVEGISLYQALCYCEDTLLKFGGHAMAAGVSLSSDKIEEFDRKINEYADNVIDGDIVLTLPIDCRLSCEGSLLSLIDEISRLEPFGCDNERPVFAISDAIVRSVRKTRDERHMMLKFQKNGKEFSAIAFGFGEMADKIRLGDKISVAAHLEKNEYMGSVSPQFHIIDIRVEGRR